MHVASLSRAHAACDAFGMPWLKLPPIDATIRSALQRAREGYPPEYGAPIDQRQVPANVAADSIVLAHSWIPEALAHLFATLAALYDPKLPLSRKQHELIAATVSSLNQCVY